MDQRLNESFAVLRDNISTSLISHLNAELHYRLKGQPEGSSGLHSFFRAIPWFPLTSITLSAALITFIISTGVMLLHKNSTLSDTSLSKGKHHPGKKISTKTTSSNTQSAYSSRSSTTTEQLRQWASTLPGKTLSKFNPLFYNLLAQQSQLINGIDLKQVNSHEIYKHHKVGLFQPGLRQHTLSSHPWSQGIMYTKGSLRP
jgi:hypothetical protein